MVPCSQTSLLPKLQHSFSPSSTIVAMKFLLHNFLTGLTIVDSITLFVQTCRHCPTESFMIIIVYDFLVRIKHDILVSFYLYFGLISHCLLLLIFGNIYFHRFQQILLVLLNIGHIHSGSRNIALLMNMTVLHDVAVVSEWRLV